MHPIVNPKLSKIQSEIAALKAKRDWEGLFNYPSKLFKKEQSSEIQTILQEACEFSIENGLKAAEDARAAAAIRKWRERNNKFSKSGRKAHLEKWNDQGGYALGVSKNELYRLAVEQGYAPAQVNLAICHQLGSCGFEKDVGKTINLLQLASNQGLARATYLLGACYEEGRGVQKDIEEAFRLYNCAIAQPNPPPEVEYQLALCHDRGEGTPESEETAIKLYRLAAERKFAPAQCELGRCHELAIGGLPRNEREAARLFKLSAEQGWAEAQRRLGIYYKKGRGGCKKKPEEAVRLFKLAAAQNDNEARVELADCYKRGLGLSKDEKQAVNLYTLSAERGDRDAQYKLALYYEEGIGGLLHNEREAIKWYLKAAEQGHVLAQNNLGLLYLHSRDFFNAPYWLNQAAEQGFSWALYNLASCYLEIAKLIQLGQLPKDLEQAYKLYYFHLGRDIKHLFHDFSHRGFALFQQAANQGSIRAKISLVQIYGRINTPESIEYANQLYAEIAAERLTEEVQEFFEEVQQAMRDEGVPLSYALLSKPSPSPQRLQEAKALQGHGLVFPELEQKNAVPEEFFALPPKADKVKTIGIPFRNNKGIKQESVPPLPELYEWNAGGGYSISHVYYLCEAGNFVPAENVSRAYRIWNGNSLENQYGAIHPSAYKENDAALMKIFEARLERGIFATAKGKQGIKFIEHIWLGCQSFALYEIKLKGGEGRGDERLLGYLRNDALIEFRFGFQHRTYEVAKRRLIGFIQERFQKMGRKFF